MLSLCFYGVIFFDDLQLLNIVYTDDCFAEFISSNCSICTWWPGLHTLWMHRQKLFYYVGMRMRSLIVVIGYIKAQRSIVWQGYNDKREKKYVELHWRMADTFPVELHEFIKTNSFPLKMRLSSMLNKDKLFEWTAASSFKYVLKMWGIM